MACSLASFPLQHRPQVHDHGWNMHAGTFDTQEEAMIAYNAKVVALGQGHELHQVKHTADAPLQSTPKMSSAGCAVFHRVILSRLQSRCRQSELRQSMHAEEKSNLCSYWALAFTHLISERHNLCERLLFGVLEPLRVELVRNIKYHMHICIKFGCWSHSDKNEVRL